MENYKTYLWFVIPIGILVALGILMLINPFFIISAGERGIVMKWGNVDRVMSEGIHWRTPIVEEVEEIDIKTQKEEVKATAASKDLQNVTTVVAMNYNLLPDKVGELWKTIGEDYKIRIIDPAIQEAIKAATAKYTAEELITKRETVREDIKTVLIERLQKEFIVVTEISIVDFQFSQSFDNAIESKVTAEQNALAAKNTLEQSKYEAEQRIAQAKGEAEAIRIQANAINAQGGEDYVKLKAIEKWNGMYPTQYWGSTSGIPLINIGK